MLEWIKEPFEFGFMQHAFLGIVLAGLNCAWIGSYVVLRRMAFMGEALAHTILPGVVFAYMRAIPLFWGALGASLLTALGVGYLSSRKGVREDTAIGVVLSGMFALGVLMMTYVRSFRDFGSILFGSILSISQSDLLFIGCITAALGVILMLVHKELELSSYDEDYAKMIGVRPRRLRMLLLLLIAFSVVSAVEMMGALLTTALVVIPAAAASLCARTVFQTMLIASFIAVFSGIVGLYISYYFEVSSGASIVLCCFFCFLMFWSGSFWWKRRNLKG